MRKEWEMEGGREGEKERISEGEWEGETEWSK